MKQFGMEEAAPEEGSDEPGLPTMASWGIRAAFGTDKTRNACHGSDSSYSAQREIDFFFGGDKKWERTLAMIKPDAFAAGRAEEIVKAIEDADFVVCGRVDTTLTEERAREFYAEHEGKGF